MAQPVNPYVVGPPTQGDKGFFGRQDTLEWVKRGLRNPAVNSVVLFGQRRIGKTTLLLQLQRALPSQSFLPVYFDLHGQATRPLSQVLAELANQIAKQVELEPPKPEMFDDRGLFFSRTFLPQAHAAIGRVRRLVFLLDEFDVVDEATEEDLPPTAATHALLRLVRRVMNKDHRPAFVFAVGRRIDDLAVDFTASFRASLVREIWVLDRESAEALVRQAEVNRTLRFTDEAVARILKLTSGHPYLTQSLCRQIWERAYARRPNEIPQIDLQEVEAAVPNTLKAVDQTFDWIWDGLSLAECIYASGMAETVDEGESITQEAGLRVLADHAARLRTAEVELKASRDLVRRRVLDLCGEDEHRFAIELFRRWVRQRMPLREVKDELDQVDPLADELFGIGLEFLRRNQLKAAIRYFRDALSANPHHFHARLRLGETLLQLNQASRAVVELERAYQLDAGEARLLLARALVTQARDREEAEDEASALASCERALQISPGNQAAQKIRHSIMMRKLEAEARSHEKAERWAAATPIYEQLAAQAPDKKSREIWQAAFERCRREKVLARLYEEGIEALRRRNWKQAQRAFAEVVHGRPDYGADRGYAAKLLLRAVREKPVTKHRWALMTFSIVAVLAVVSGFYYVRARNRPEDTPAPAPQVQLPEGMNLPPHVEPVEIYDLDTNHSGDREWVVLYRFDLSAETEREGSPIGGLVYTQQDDGSPSTTPLQLRTPDNEYLCECECLANTENVLSALPFEELVVRDTCNEETTRAFIFHWEPNTGQYVPEGHFTGNRVQVARNTVTVTQRVPHMDQLALELVYVPRNGGTYYQPNDRGIVAPEKHELVFYGPEPGHVTLSPYPEKVVLAFYKHYTDGERVAELFTPTGWEQVEQCTAGHCGCLAEPQEVTHVRVTNLKAEEDIGSDQATFEAKIICELGDGQLENETTLHWYLVRQDGQWKLDRAESGSTQ